MITWILGGLIAGLVVLYIVNPPVRRAHVSAARFMAKLPQPPKPVGGRIRLGRLLTSPLFWLQLLVLAVLWWAAWSDAGPIFLHGPRNVGLWLLVDTSASMTTIQGDQTRMAEAQRLAAVAITNSAAATLGGTWCARIEAFDMASREVGMAVEPRIAAAALTTLTPRPLGTDLKQLRSRLLVGGMGDDTQTCQITDVVVVSDQPAPPWLNDVRLPVKWQDIAHPVPNIGFTTIQPVRNQLTGEVFEVQYEIMAYGAPVGPTTLTINGPTGVIRSDQINWAEQRIVQDRFRPTKSDIYTLTLSADGVYAYDDTASIVVQDPEPIHLDWGISDTTVLNQLGWLQDTVNPLVRVVPLADLPTVDLKKPQKPLLVVGQGYVRSAVQLEQRIGDFDEASPLLSDLNLDVAEQAGVQGTTGLPSEFHPVISGIDGRIWIAMRPEPLAVYVPGLPIWTNDNVGAFSQTVFFNAMRLLLAQRPLPSLYTLTSPNEPEPKGTHLALHPGEGDTSTEGQSVGSLEQWEIQNGQADQGWLWAPLIVVAIAVFLVERIAMVLRGNRWG